MKQTIDVIADRAYDESKTVLPVEYARGFYMHNAPSLRALKLMHLMIAKAGVNIAEPALSQIFFTLIQITNNICDKAKNRLIILIIKIYNVLCVQRRR